MQERGCILLLSQGKVASNTLHCAFRKTLPKRGEIYFRQEGVLTGGGAQSLSMRTGAGEMIGVRRQDLMEIARQCGLGGVPVTPPPPPPRKKIKVIVPIRDPFSRLVAGCLQNFPRLTARLPALQGADHYFDADRLRTAVIERFTIITSNARVHGMMSKNWLEKQVCPYFQIDPDAIFNHPDVLTGRLRLSKGNMDMLIFRYDLEHAEKERIIGRFIAMPEFKLTETKNVGEDKPVTGDIYRFFKQHVKFPRAFYDEVCQSRFYHAFYTEAERDRMEQRWIDPAM